MNGKTNVTGNTCFPSITDDSSIKKLKNILKNKNNLTDTIEYSKIMSDKTRVSIIYLLHKKGSLCVCDLANILDMSPQAISNQLIKLYDKGIINREKKGLSVSYSLLNKDFISFLYKIL